MRFLAIFALSFASGCQAPPDAGLSGDFGALLAAGPPVDVYLIAGQSNAVGGARVAALESAEVRRAYGGAPEPIGFAQEINCPTDGSGDPCALSTGWQELTPRDGSFGIELSAGRRLRERFGADLVLLKHATNGSSLFRDWESSGDADLLWVYLNAFLDQRLAELPVGSRVAGLFWIQGNADAKVATAADEYADNLSWLVTRLRQERGCVPVVLDRLHAATVYPYRDVVRAEQEGMPLLFDDVVVVDVDDLALRAGDPPQHYTADSFIELGRRMADAMPGCD